MTEFFRKNILIGSAEILCRLPLIFTAGFLARTVGTKAYGTWALILVVQSFLAGIAGLGLSSSLSRIASVSWPEKAYGYLKLALKTSAVALAGLFLLLLLLKDSLGNLLEITPEFWWLLPLVVFYSAGVVMDGLLDAYFKAQGKILRQTLFILVRTCAEIVAVLLVFGLCASRGFSVEKLLATYMLMVPIIKLLSYPWIVVLKDKLHEEIPVEVERNNFIRYGLPMVPTVLVVWLVGQGDRLVLGYLVDKHSLGIYAFGASLASYVVFLGYAVYPLLLPHASRLYDSGKKDELARLFYKSQAVFLLLLTGTLSFIALFATEIIHFTAGPDFENATEVLIVLSTAIGIEQLMGIYQYVYHLTRKPRFIFWFNLLYAVLVIASVYLTGRSGNIAYVPWGILAAVCISNLVRYLYSQREIKIPVPLWLMLGLACSLTLVMGIVVLANEWTIIPRILLVLTILGGAALLLTMVLRGGFIVRLLSLIPRRQKSLI